MTAAATTATAVLPEAFSDDYPLYSKHYELTRPAGSPHGLAAPGDRVEAPGPGVAQE